MSILRAWFAGVRATFGGDRSHLDEEIKQHVELLSVDYVRRGFTAAEARYAALRELGNLTSLRQEYREQKRLPLLENLCRDLTFAIRTLRRNPVFTASCVATFAVGL